MSEPLKDIIKARIEHNGPMSVDSFMSCALTHPEHGYYMKQDPFGRAGDFVTAPEVSQMFGEMIGAWVADLWIQMGRLEKLILLECGPGRGTLMADMLRATKNVDGFHGVLDICLIEVSPVLKEMQREALQGYEVSWCNDFTDAPKNAPIIVVGNEFLDALPFKQYVGDVERKIDVRDGELVFVPEGENIKEVSVERKLYVDDICACIEKQGGAALLIDYGHVKTGVGDTFQAIKGHEYVDVLSHIGDADLTSHVDFEALQDEVEVNICGPVTQGAFLKALGIEVRTQMLLKSLTQHGDDQGKKIEKDLQRLIDSDQMGELFKVIAFWNYKHELKPAGF